MQEGLTPLRVAVRMRRVELVALLLRGGCGTTRKHITFDQVHCDAIDPHIQKLDWQMWTRITGEMPKYSDDGWPIEERDFDGRKKGEEGWMEDWPTQIVAE